MVKGESVVLMRAWHLYVKAHFKIIRLCRNAHTLIEFQIELLDNRSSGWEHPL